jgi:hypothetical protein
VSRRLLGTWAACLAVLTVLLAVRPDVARVGERLALSATSASDDHINRVLVISVDGLNPDALRRLGRSGAPALHRVMAEGPSTLNARTSYERTRTLPNHTGMLTGRVINRRAGGHGVWFNDDEAATTVHRAAGEYVRSVFDVVHDRGGRTALYTAKDKFALFDRTWSAHGARDRTGWDNGRDKISRYRYSPYEGRLTTGVIDRLLSGSRYTFLHYAAPDRAGHASGFMSAAYLDAVRRVDARIGRVMDAVRATPALRDHLAVIITSDHGGYASTHEDPTLPTSYTVPFLVWGRGMAAGADLYALNPSYADPDTSRPTYAAPAQPVRNSAAANLAMDLLDLPKVPGSQVDTTFSLRVFR